MAPKNMKLYYFDGWGRAELIRYLMAVAGFEYEDIRMTEEKWESFKPNTPYGVMPMLEVDGEKIDQSMAIARFIAKEAGLDGKTNWEMAQAEQIVGHVYDVASKMFDIHFGNNKPAATKDFIERGLLVFLKATEGILKQRGGKHFVGNRLTYADLAVAQFLNAAFEFPFPDDMPGKDQVKAVPKNFPVLEELRKTVSEIPAIQKHITSQPPNPHKM